MGRALFKGNIVVCAQVGLLVDAAEAMSCQSPQGQASSDASILTASPYLLLPSD